MLKYTHVRHNGSCIIDSNYVSVNLYAPLGDRKLVYYSQTLSWSVELDCVYMEDFGDFNHSYRYFTNVLINTTCVHNWVMTSRCYPCYDKRAVTLRYSPQLNLLYWTDGPMRSLILTLSTCPAQRLTVAAQIPVFNGESIQRTVILQPLCARSTASRHSISPRTSSGFPELKSSTTEARISRGTRWLRSYLWWWVQVRKGVVQNVDTDEFDLFWFNFQIQIIYRMHLIGDIGREQTCRWVDTWFHHRICTSLIAYELA